LSLPVFDDGAGFVRCDFELRFQIGRGRNRQKGAEEPHVAYDTARVKGHRARNARQEVPAVISYPPASPLKINQLEASGGVTFNL
jgi:hypothetical protein